MIEEVKILASGLGLKITIMWVRIPMTKVAVIIVTLPEHPLPPNLINWNTNQVTFPPKNAKKMTRRMIPLQEKMLPPSLLTLPIKVALRVYAKIRIRTA